MSDEAFATAIKATLTWEGGYVNDPADAGGETNFGISKASYPTLDIKNLTRDGAIEIYKRDFWDKLGASKLTDAIGSKVFDMAVNMGSSQAVKILQRACNHCAPQRPLAIDGQLGPQTTFTSNNVNQQDLLRMLRSECANFYIQLASEHPQMRKFLTGWLRRARS